MNNRVALLAGNRIKAEAETSDGLAIFSMKGDHLEEDLTIVVTAFGVTEYVLFGFLCDCDGSLIGNPRKVFISPEAVQIFVLAPPESKTSELPGFISRLVSTSKQCPIRRFSMDLT